MTVYVCYEENRNSLVVENGPVDELRVCRTAELAMRWFLERIKEAEEYDFVKDIEDVKVVDKAVDSQKLLNEIENGFSSLTVFKGWQENWDVSYTICTRRREVIEA